jgi:hypothetical protein
MSPWNIFDMAVSKVLIVARTRMSGEKVCIGALSEEGESLRLLNAACTSDLAYNSPYKVGEWWRIACELCGSSRPPHVEDVAVSNALKIGDERDLRKYLTTQTKSWQGKIETLFDGKIRFTNNGAGFISEADVPRYATGFWLPSSPLNLETNVRGNSGYYPVHDYKHLSYVGTQNAVPQINAGQLVRVSLARWWKPRNADPSLEERCYAQLSGWY